MRSANTLSVWVNGVVKESMTNPSYGTAFTSENNNYILLCDGWGPGMSWKGKMAEIGIVRGVALDVAAMYTSSVTPTY